MSPALVALLTFGCMLGLAALVLWLNDRFVDWRHRERRSPEQKIRDAAVLHDRLNKPRWAEVRRVTGGRPSPALLDLYSDGELLNQEDFWVRANPAAAADTEERIAAFCPADQIALEDPWCRHLPPGAFPFARDVFGDYLFVELTPDGRDQPVKHWYHDGGDIETIAPSLATFLTWCRKAAFEDVGLDG